MPESTLDGLGMLPEGLVALTENVHETHGHGPPNFFVSTERSFNAGPNFMPNEFIKWSSVNKGKPAPSMQCSRKLCNKKKKMNEIIRIVIQICGHPHIQKPAN